MLLAEGDWHGAGASGENLVMLVTGERMVSTAELTRPLLGHRGPALAVRVGAIEPGREFAPDHDVAPHPVDSSWL